MIDPIQPAAKLKIVSDTDSPFLREAQPPPVRSLEVGEEWALGRAWRLRILWDPVVQRVEDLVASSARIEGKFSYRVLLIGRDIAIVSAMLARSAARQIQFEVHVFHPDDERTLPFHDEAFDCAIALDWLPLVRPSQREIAVTELCRLARLGVVIANPFHSPEVVAAERAVNALHLSTLGKDEPDLGRHLEYGLPELQRVTAWAGSMFTHVESEPIDELGAWQTSAVVDPDAQSEVSVEDATMAALLPSLRGPLRLPAYRSLIVASSSPLKTERVSTDRASEFGALASHLAIEAAAQRRALDRLQETISSERAREREEFRETVASLAVELHEREAYAGLLAADLNERERVLADQTAVIEGLERRLDDSETDRDELSRNFEELTARFVESERRLGESESQLNRMRNTVGWRLLSRYGRLKFGVLFPVYRMLGRVSPETHEIKRMRDKSELSASLSENSAETHDSK